MLSLGRMFSFCHHNHVGISLTKAYLIEYSPIWMAK
jgi:hypothetical protein